MIPRKEVISQINRFYDLVESKGKQMEVAIETKTLSEDDNLGLDYFILTTRIGGNMQNAISNLKDELDAMEAV